MRLFDFWMLHRKATLVCCALLGAVLGFGGLVAVVLHASSDSATGAASRPPATRRTTSPSASTPAAPASDVAEWDAMPAITPATSPAYPALAPESGRDPGAFATAFATQLFTRDYHAAARGELLSWAQYENAPLRSANYPAADWTKVLVDSLTDLTWDSAVDTPVPAPGVWLGLSAEQARDTVSGLKVSLDPAWEAAIAGGYQPPDPLATVRDVTLLVTRQATVGSTQQVSRFSISLAIQLGTSARGGYGAAVTNNYVVKEVS